MGSRPRLFGRSDKLGPIRWATVDRIILEHGQAPGASSEDTGARAGGSSSVDGTNA